MSLANFTNKIIKELGSKIGSLLVEEPLNNPIIEEARKNKCRGSADIKPCLFYKKDTDQCKVCSCFIDVKASAKTNYSLKKNEIEITHCPMGWWEDADIAHKYRSR